MVKRVTIILDDKILQKLREVQGNAIKNQKKAISLSKTINIELAKSLGVDYE